MNSSGARLNIWLLVGPPVALVAIALITYAVLRTFSILVWAPILLLPVLVGALGCIAAEIIAVPSAIIAMYREPSLRTLGNVAAVFVGTLVLAVYPASFFFMTGQ